MIWVWVFVAIAVVGLIVMISYGVWLFHKAADIYAELKMLGKRGEEIQALLNQLELNPQVSRSGAGATLVPVDEGTAADLEPVHNG